MEFALLFTEREARATPDPDGFAAMSEFVGELAKRGKLMRGAPLGSARDGATVRVREGKAFVSDGPFAESKEVVGGFWIIDAADRAEAIEIAQRTPHARYGSVEVHPIDVRYTYPDRGRQTPFLMVFRMEPGLCDPDGSKLREMIAFGESLEGEATLLETAPLASDPPPARVEVRKGRVLVTDGPFAEAKEAVGGYAVVRVADRAAAIELAKRYPHARWVPVEVREILFFDPV